MDTPILKLRSGIQTPLSWVEVDNNFSQLKNSLLQLQTEIANSPVDPLEFQQLQINVGQVQGQFNDLQTSFNNLPNFTYIESQITNLSNLPNIVDSNYEDLMNLQNTVSTLQDDVSNLPDVSALQNTVSILQSAYFNLQNEVSGSTHVVLYPTRVGKALFFGGSSNYINNPNIVTIFTGRLDLARLETYISAPESFRYGASFGSNLGFYVHSDFKSLSNEGTLLINTTSIGTDRYALSGTKVDDNTCMAYGGRTGFGGGDNLKILTFIDNYDGTLLSENTSIGSGPQDSASAKLIDHLYYGSSHITIISDAGTLLDDNISVSGNQQFAGCGLDSIALFYGGKISNDPINSLELINNSGTVTENITNIGTARCWLAGAQVYTNALFYGGESRYVDDITDVSFNIGTLISPIGVLVQSEVSVGIPRDNLGGGGF